MSDTDECVFCEIITGRRDATVLFESEGYVCFLDAYPVNPGHALVVPQHHVQRLEDIDWAGLTPALKRAHQLLIERFDPDATNIGINNGRAAGQTIQHLHWHIIPRYKDDIEDPTGGVRGVIPSERIYEP